MRYFVAFSYNGTAYHGWQNQPNAITVQEVLEKALSTLLREQIHVVGAGRTDAGVHAKQMYAHFDSDQRLDFGNLVFRMNSFLPDDIAIQGFKTAKPDAHARFDALERTYEYWIVQHKNPFYSTSAHCIVKPLEIDAMNEATSILKGYRDFECFSKSNTDVKTFICDIKSAFWTEGPEKLVFTITADRFLRNMVRAIVGTVLEVGLERIKPSAIKTILESKDRSKAGVSVPAKGLYLTRVIYPETIFE